MEDKPLTVTKPKCMVPFCQNKAAKRKRGLCVPCFLNAQDLVNEGLTTWEKLTERGKCSREGLKVDVEVTRKYFLS